jgi:hypothetical protein
VDHEGSVRFAPVSPRLFPLVWWNWRVAEDPAMRADLAAARIVVLWAMGSHDIGPAILGGCSGDWPDPLKTCFEAATAKIPAETDRLFAAIAGLVPTSRRGSHPGDLRHGTSLSCRLGWLGRREAGPRDGRGDEVDHPEHLGHVPAWMCAPAVRYA